ncbi:MAG TPA: hypothetical protein VL282_05275, partial [Tepidisphaeraceae bacterium]|nr:hypothetical protein [Tepidisphaeraceae bacterium]
MTSKGRPRPVLLADEEAPVPIRTDDDEGLLDPFDHRIVRVGLSWNLIVAGVLLLIVGVTYVNSFQSGWVLDNLYIIRS